MRQLPEPGQIFRHFKGTLYRVICIARDSETMEEVVVYENREESEKKFVRPLSEFMSRTDKEKYPDAEQEYRFEEVSGEERDKPATDGKPLGAGVNADSREGSGEEDIPSVLMDFLDAEGNEAKLDALERGRMKLNNDVISAMAASLDTEIREGSIDDRYRELKDHLLTVIRYEGSRLRN